MKLTQRKSKAYQTHYELLMSLIVDSHRKKRTPVLVGIATRRRVMKFGVVCDVEGKTYLDNGATVEYKGMRYIFYIKDIKERLLTQVRIISDVDDSDQYSYHRSEVAPDGSFTVTQNYEPHIYQKLIRELQTLE